MPICAMCWRQRQVTRRPPTRQTCRSCWLPRLRLVRQLQGSLLLLVALGCRVVLSFCPVILCLGLLRLPLPMHYVTFPLC